MDRQKSTVGEMLASIPNKIKSEISALRQRTFRFPLRMGSLGGKYKLNTTHVDYSLARDLYNNEKDEYKLGAWAAKPVINTAVGFMGIPAFVAIDPEAQFILEQFRKQNSALQQEVHRNTLRDGDCWVWITREEADELDLLYPELEGVKFNFNIIPPEMIDFDKCVRDPRTGQITEYVFESTHTWKDRTGSTRKCTIIERINKEERSLEIDGDVPEGMEAGTVPNQWGFVPIVQFSNERDMEDAFGRSDLEPIEPFMKAYHDVMIHAIEGNKLHSTPKLKLQVKDVAAFLKNNFGIEDIAKHVQEGKTISLDGHDLLMLQDEDDAGFLEVRSSTGDAKVLLKLLFMCIVDVSETPEFAFGVHTPSAQASVREQMPVLVRRITRKRDHFSVSWSMLIRMLLAMHSSATGKKYVSHEVELLWDEIDPRDEVETAKAIKDLVEGLTKAVAGWLISQESAVNFLAQYIDTMQDFVTEDENALGERDRIIRDKIRMSGGLEDSELAEEEQKLLDEALAKLKEEQNG